MHATLEQTAREAGYASYTAYLESDHWKGLRSSLLSAKCFACDRSKPRRLLHLHHATYERLGSERPADLVTLCDTCHARTHRIARSISLLVAHEVCRSQVASGEFVPTVEESRKAKPRKGRTLAERRVKQEARRVQAKKDAKAKQVMLKKLAALKQGKPQPPSVDSRVPEVVRDVLRRRNVSL